MLLNKLIVFLKANPTAAVIKKSDPLFKEVTRLRYKVYCEEKGFLERSAYPDHVEEDEYDDRSIHIVVTARSEIAGYCRVILPNHKGLPIFKNFKLDEDDNPNSSCEVSRFIIAEEYRNDKLVRREIFRLLAQEILKVVYENKIKKIYAVVEDWLLGSLQRRGYYFAKIGEGKHYMGAVTYPTKLIVGK